MTYKENDEGKVMPKATQKVTGSSFLINHEFHDFYSDIQHSIRRLGDIGPESKQYKDAAFHQFARQQDDFTAPLTYGTLGREDNKNHNRMEYDKVGRPDNKDHASVMKEVSDKKELDVKKLLNILKPKDVYTVSTTNTEVSFNPIKMPNDVNMNFPDKK